jgi:hypothetical protein
LQTETTDKDITDVLASVEETYGDGDRMSAHDGSEQGEGDIGSLELSLTPTQDVDGTEPVTQIEDVPAQLAAEEERVAQKIVRARERKSKAIHDAGASNVGPIAYHRRERRSKAANDAEAYSVVPEASRTERRSKVAHDDSEAPPDDSDATIDDSVAAHVDPESAPASDADADVAAHVDPESASASNADADAASHDDNADAAPASDADADVAAHVDPESASASDINLSLVVPSSPVTTHRKRGVVRKKRMADAGIAGTPRRSPRVSAVSSVDGSTRQSPRILNMQKASPLGVIAKGKQAKSKVEAGSSHFILVFINLPDISVSFLIT